VTWQWGFTRGRKFKQAGHRHCRLHVILCDLQLPLFVKGAASGSHFQNGDCCAQDALLMGGIGM